MFGKQLSLTHLAFGLGLVMVASYVGNRFRENLSESDEKDDYEMVKKYLLNDTALYGKNRPKLWIHSAYEINARKWKNFMSRTSTDLNQPYLYLTIQSIINHCGDDFHVCLIDDDSFEKLIPSWEIRLNEIPEPMKTRYRNLAMLQLIYIYGGMQVPNSFLCTKPLIDLYSQGVSEKTPFLAEKRHYGSQSTKPFMPDIQFIGARKEDPKIQALIYEVNRTVGNHFQKESEFNAVVEKWCLEQVDTQEMQLIDGKIIGIKTTIGKPILLEDLMSEEYLDVDAGLLHGIYIPKQELLKRSKFQYYAILPYQEVLESSCILSKYFKISIVDGADEYYKKHSKKTIVMAL